MMPEYKLVRLSVALGSALVISGCAIPNFMKVDAVDDNVEYQKTASSIKALAIPPGLSNPGFDGTYASVQTQSGSTSTPVQSRSASSLASVQNNSATTVTSSGQASSSASSLSSSNTSSGRSVSLGAALLEESGSAVQKEPVSRPAPRPVSRIDALNSAASIQTQQAQVAQTPSPSVQSRQTRSAPTPAVQTQRPKPAVSSAKRSGNPQVAMMRLNSGEPALAVNAPYSRTWASLAPVLSAVGLKVTKQQSDQGIYTTVYQGSSVANIEAGKTFLILVAENASRQSFIGVADAKGKPAPDPIANAVLNRLRAEYER